MGKGGDGKEGKRERDFTLMISFNLTYLLKGTISNTVT
jgi:hypothetical protein